MSQAPRSQQILADQRALIEALEREIDAMFPIVWDPKAWDALSDLVIEYIEVCEWQARELRDAIGYAPE